METTKFKSVSEYIASFPPGKRKLLKEMRSTIQKAAPEAREVISYNMPTFKLNGGLVTYAAFKEHISLFAITSAMEKTFGKKLDEYHAFKSTLRFPLNKPLPLDLIREIVTVRVKENEERMRTKGKKRR